jgi:hypothetical protein
MKHLLTLTVLAAAVAHGQNAPKLNARELFYTPPPNSGAATAATNAAATAASTATKSAATASASTSTGTKKPTVAQNTSSGSRPSGNPSSRPSGTSSVATSSGANSPATSTVATTASPSTSAAGSSDPVIAQVGQPATSGTHIINASATSGPLGLRYSVLKRDSSGGYAEVDPDTSFKTGDAIRLQVEANSAGYLYVVTQGTSGQWQLLFPRPEVSGGSNRIEAHSKIEVPGNRGVWKFDEHAGTEKLFVVLARQPEADLDKLIYAIGSPASVTPAAGTPAPNGGREALLAQATIRDEVVARMRDQMLSRDLVFEKVDEATSDSAPVQNEKAAYVVNISNAPDARVVKDFALQHR